MKSAVILSLFLITLPTWLVDFKKDKLIIFASLSYYGCDFDGDRINDLSLWDPKTNTLYYQLSSNKKSYERKFFDNDISYEPIFCDYDGDGKTDFGFFQKDSGQWIIFLTSNPSLQQKTFLGSIGDLPIPANIDGDKKYEIAIWRPIASAWVLTDTDKEGNKKLKVIHEGSYQDSAFAGDYDGDGKSDLCVWRPDDGYWHIVKSSADFNFAQSEHIQHGREWDVIVPNDYNADGKCDLVFWRPKDQTWYFIYANSEGQNQIKFGDKDDIPLSSDLDGDRIPELITWNNSKKSWNVLNFKKQEFFSYKWMVPDGCVPATSILQKYE